MKTTIRNEHAMAGLGRELREMLKAGPVDVTYKPHSKSRSDDQNALSFAWYQQIADDLGEDTALGVRCFCKLTAGVPILYSEDEDFRAAWDRSLAHLTYEQKLEAMAFVPVTSLMKTKQLSAYLKAVQKLYEGSVLLMFPEELAQMQHYQQGRAA